MENTTNPIVRDFNEYGEGNATDWLYCLEHIGTGDGWPIIDYLDVIEDAVTAATPEQITEARQVLSALVAA